MRKIIVLLFGVIYLQAQDVDSLQVDSQPLAPPQKVSQKKVSIIKKVKNNNQAKISGLTYFDYTYSDSVGFFDIKSRYSLIIQIYYYYIGINSI